eukprot:jgi/Chlat1/3400/Chrsp23S03816
MSSAAVPLLSLSLAHRTVLLLSTLGAGRRRAAACCGLNARPDGTAACRRPTPEQDAKLVPLTTPVPHADNPHAAAPAMPPAMPLPTPLNKLGGEGSSRKKLEPVRRPLGRRLETGSGIPWRYTPTKNDEYERRPIPAEGPVARSVETGFCHRHTFQLFMPARGSIFGPTGWSTHPLAQDPPSHSLRLDHVHGYRAHDARHNIAYVNNGKHLVYHAAAVGVVLDTARGRQKHFLGHNDDILCLDTTKDGEYVVTGEVGKQPSIFVWKASDCQMQAELKGFHSRAVVAIAFHPSSRFIGTVGLDEHHSVAIYDWRSSQLLGSARGDSGRILYCDFNPVDGRLVTGGEKGVKFWKMEGGALVGKKGVWGKVGGVSTVLSIGFTPDGCTLTGTQSGAIIKWGSEGSVEAVKKFDACHQGPVHEITFAADYIISGGKDGKVNFYNPFMELRFSIDMSKSSASLVDDQNHALSYPDGRSPCVKAIAYDSTRKRLAVGTKSSEIYEFDLSTEDGYKSNRKLVAQGHAGALDKEKGVVMGEVWGVDCHATRDVFATASDDRSVRKTPQRCRSVAFHPKNAHLAVGTFRGQVLVFDGVTATQITQIQHGKEWVSQLKYSPCGKYLAVGSHDRYVGVYDVYRGAGKDDGGVDGVGASVDDTLCVQQGHTASVTQMDWSADSMFLQTNSADNELLFCEDTSHTSTLLTFTPSPLCLGRMPSGEQIKNSSELRDADWHTFTCTIAWPTQGIWPSEADGSDINACARTRQGAWWEDECVLASADDFGLIKLFRFPSDVARADYKKYQGHSAHVTNVAFSGNDKYLMSTGGGDRCIFQWRHLQPNEEDNGGDSDDESSEETSSLDQSRGNKLVLMSQTGIDGGVPSYQPANALEGIPNPYKNHSVRELGAVKGMKSPMVGRPCLGQTFPPSQYTPSYEMPGESLQLQWVYGYRGYDTRNNVFYTAAGDVAYHVAAWGVVYNKEKHAQRFITDDPMSDNAEGNTDDILCMARHPKGVLFATGEIGRQPKIIVWDSSTMQRVTLHLS